MNIRLTGSGLMPYRLLLVMAGLVGMMAFTNPAFFSAINLVNLFSHMSINGILAMGMTLLMISRCFDLSVGSTMVLSGVITVMLVRVIGIPGAIILGSLSGVLMGWLNGILVIRFQINSFIATLGTMVIFQGIAFSLTDMRPVSSRTPAFQLFAAYEVFGRIPVVIFYFFAVVFVIWLLSRFSLWGKYAYAIGGNQPACRMMGIDVDKYSMLYFIISGLGASFGGVLLSSRIDAASAVFGENVALPVIASIVIGGVSLTGGVGSVSGVLQGIILLGLIENVVVYIGLYGYYQLLFRAVILLAVIVFDVLYSGFSASLLEKSTLKALREPDQEET